MIHKYIYTCMYVYIYIYTHTYIYTYTHLYMSTNQFVQLPIQNQVHCILNRLVHVD